jgi:hypothetical protein
MKRLCCGINEKTMMLSSPGVFSQGQHVAVSRNGSTGERGAVVGCTKDGKYRVLFPDGHVDELAPNRLLLMNQHQPNLDDRNKYLNVILNARIYDPDERMNEIEFVDCEWDNCAVQLICRVLNSDGEVVPTTSEAEAFLNNVQHYRITLIHEESAMRSPSCTAIKPMITITNALNGFDRRRNIKVCQTLPAAVDN